MADYMHSFLIDISCFVIDGICQRLILVLKSFITVRSLMVVMDQNFKSFHPTGPTNLSSPVLQQERGLILWSRQMRSVTVNIPTLFLAPIFLVLHRIPLNIWFRNFPILIVFEVMCGKTLLREGELTFLLRDAKGFSHCPLDLLEEGTPLSFPRCQKSTMRQCLSELTIRNERYLQIRVYQGACLTILNTSLLRQRRRKLSNTKLMEVLVVFLPRRPVPNKMEAR